jgi:hypothetical protein
MHHHVRVLLFEIMKSQQQKKNNLPQHAEEAGTFLRAISLLLGKYSE